MPNQSTAGPADGRVPLKVAEVAARYGVDESTIYRRIKAGELAAFRIGKGRGTVRVPASALVDFETSALAAARSEVAA